MLGGAVHLVRMRERRPGMTITDLNNQLSLRLGNIHPRHIRLINGTSVLEYDKPLLELVDWYHLGDQITPHWASFEIDVDVVIMPGLCSWRGVHCVNSPWRCCADTEYCCVDHQSLDWVRHRAVCMRRPLRVE